MADAKIVEPKPIVEPPVDPTLDDLREWVRRGFEQAYEHRDRPQMSRQDMAYGWLQCLLYLRSFGSFKPRDQ